MRRTWTATQKLAHLAKRFDELTQMAASMQPAPTPRATAAMPGQPRPPSRGAYAQGARAHGSRSRGGPLPLDESDDDAKTPRRFVAA